LRLPFICGEPRNAIGAARRLLPEKRFHGKQHYKNRAGVVMFHTLVSSLVEFNAFWLIWAAVGVLILAACIVIASAITSETTEPYFSAARRSDDERKMIV
jgi:type IV secretory pathway component VirB8